MCMDVQILFLWTASVYALSPCRKHCYFFQDRIGFLLLFVWQLFTKCWNHSSPSRCSLTSTDTFYSNPFFLLRDVIFQKKKKNLLPNLLCYNHQKWESNHITICLQYGLLHMSCVFFHNQWRRNEHFWDNLPKLFQALISRSYNLTLDPSHKERPDD